MMADLGNLTTQPFIPRVQSNLRHGILEMPKAIYEASGIVINGRRIKSLVFTTDLAIIRNCDADAVFAVYPFTPQQAISDAIIKASYIPVFCGVGGGTTKGLRTIGLAKDVESQGAMGVVLNAPITDLNLAAVAKTVDIPVIITVVNQETDIERRLLSGASILNVAGGMQTPEIRGCRMDKSGFVCFAFHPFGEKRRREKTGYAAVRPKRMQPTSTNPRSGNSTRTRDRQSKKTRMMARKR